jgi:hypothetical protein
MRVSKLAYLALFGALAAAPKHATAQISVNLRFGRPLVVTSYAPEVYGDWRTDYRRWQPVTVYYLNGSYYPRSVRGARPVVVYRSHNQYFFPPRDQDWDHKDRRYNYNRRPNDDDYTRAGPPQGRGRGRGRGPG